MIPTGKSSFPRQTGAYTLTASVADRLTFPSVPTARPSSITISRRSANATAPSRFVERLANYRSRLRHSERPSGGIRLTRVDFESAFDSWNVPRSSCLRSRRAPGLWPQENNFSTKTLPGKTFVCHFEFPPYPYLQILSYDIIIYT